MISEGIWIERACGLFDALRELRTEIAREQGVPPYIIFHDKTLNEMAEQQPVTLEQMRGINGVGEQKLQRYGERFLGLLCGQSPTGLDHGPEAENPVSLTVFQPDTEQ